jgi:hypothetical protein
MKKHNFRSLIATASLVLGLSDIGPAHADAIGGHLGAVEGATDVYAVTCPAGTVSVEASVNDAITAGTQVSVQLINPNGSAITASAVDGGGPSGFVTLDGGAGSYLAIVSKNTEFGEGYGVSIHCNDAVGALAETIAVLVQNQ